MNRSTDEMRFLVAKCGSGVFTVCGNGMAFWETSNTSWKWATRRQTGLVSEDNLCVRPGREAFVCTLTLMA